MSEPNDAAVAPDDARVLTTQAQLALDTNDPADALEYAEAAMAHGGDPLALALAAEAMRRLLLQYRQQGVGILLVSEDMQELFSLSDRLAVMYHGRIVGLTRPDETDAYQVGRLMTGGK